MTTGLLLRQALSASVGLTQALAATSIAVSAAQIKATFDAQDYEASTSGRIIGGLALPLIASLTSLYLARCSYARLAPTMSMRKVRQLDPKLAWPTLVTKATSFVTAFLLPVVNGAMAYKRTWREESSDETLSRKNHFLRALHRETFTELKMMWQDPSPEREEANASAQETDQSRRHRETTHQTLQAKRWAAFKQDGQIGLRELKERFKEAFTTQKDCVQRTIEAAKRQWAALRGES